MAKHAFLSEAWVAAAHEVGEEFRGKVAPPAHEVKMNLVITDVPHREGNVEAHLDTTGDELIMDLGHIDGEDLTVTLDYTTAKAIFIENDSQAGMQAFLGGKIKVQGDMTKLMAFQSGAAQSGDASSSAAELAARIVEITE